MAKTSPLLTSTFSAAPHGTPITAQAGEFVGAPQQALRGFVVVVQVSQAREIDVPHRKRCAVIGIGSSQRDVSSSTKRAGENIGANVANLQAVVRE